ncbi:MAG: hypothetical protein KJS95_10975 [Gammaproteobacteria bacterium]|nr:hypothetical protein [Gammaproteobacteria bacterium]
MRARLRSVAAIIADTRQFARRHFTFLDRNGLFFCGADLKLSDDAIVLPTGQRARVETLSISCTSFARSSAAKSEGS